MRPYSRVRRPVRVWQPQPLPPSFSAPLKKPERVVKSPVNSGNYKKTQPSPKFDNKNIIPLAVATSMMLKKRMTRKPMRRIRVRRKPETMPKMHTQTFGETVSHSLTLIQPNGKPKDMKLSGVQIPQIAPGGTSDTRYVATLKSRRTVNENVLKMANNFELLCNSYYSLTTGAIADPTAGSPATAINKQAYGDMTYGMVAASSPPSSAAGIGCCLFNGRGIYANTYLVPSALYTTMTNNQTIEYVQKMYVSRADMTTMITNQTAYNNIVDIYEVVAKNGTTLQGSQSTFAPIPGGATYFPYTTVSPAYYWAYGMAFNDNVNLATGTSSVSASTLDCKPWDSQIFADHWKIAAHYRIDLGPGSVHRHQSTYHINRVMNQRMIADCPLMAGITRNILIVLRGSPVYDSTAKNHIASGPAAVSVTHDIVYRTKMFEHSTITTENYTVYPAVDVGNLLTMTNVGNQANDPNLANV